MNTFHVHPPTLCRQLRELRKLSFVGMAKAIDDLRKRRGNDGGLHVAEIAMAVQFFESAAENSAEWALLCATQDVGAWIEIVVSALNATGEEVIALTTPLAKRGVS